MGGGGVCGRGEKGVAFCSVCIFHNQKMHIYLIYFCLFNQIIPFLQQIILNLSLVPGFELTTSTLTTRPWLPPYKLMHFNFTKITLSKQIVYKPNIQEKRDYVLNTWHNV